MGVAIAATKQEVLTISQACGGREEEVRQLTHNAVPRATARDSSTNQMSHGTPIYTS